MREKRHVFDERRARNNVVEVAEMHRECMMEIASARHDLACWLPKPDDRPLVEAVMSQSYRKQPATKVRAEAFEVSRTLAIQSNTINNAEIDGNLTGSEAAAPTMAKSSLVLDTFE